MTEPHGLQLHGEAREVALAEAQTVQSLAHDETMRARLAELVAAVDGGSVDGEAAELLESVLELGLQTGRVRAYYGPGGEQAAVSTLRRLPKGRERSQSASEVSKALEATSSCSLRSIDDTLECDRRARSTTAAILKLDRRAVST